MVWCFILTSAFVSGTVIINEVMYNPAGTDNNHEFIEIYTQNYLNLTGFIIGDSSSNDSLIQLSSSPTLYSLIVEEGFNFTGINASIYSAGSTIGNNLNDEDSLSFYFPNGTLIDQISYNSSWGGKDNNKSLERRQDNTWGESKIDGGTPGSLNSLANTSLDFANLKISEILANPHDEDNDPKPLGEWVELYNQGNTEIFLGGLHLQDAVGGKLFISDDKVISPNGLYLPAHEYVVIYRDGDADFNLNNNGPESVFLMMRDLVINQRFYDGTTEGMSWSVLKNNLYLTLPTEGVANEFTEGCDWFLLLNITESISQPDDFAFTLSVNRFFGFENRNITVRGQIEDLNGDIIREFEPWTNDPIASYALKRYSPNLKDGIYQIRFWFEDLQCEDVDTSDNAISRLVAINPQYRQFESVLAIEQISGSKGSTLKWGNQVLAKVYVYKGNATKSTVKAWAELEGKKVSPDTTLSVPDQFQEYHLTLPLQLYPHCDDRDSTNELTLHVEGLGKAVAKSFTVTGSDNKVCQEIIMEEKSTSKPKLQYMFLDPPAQVSPGEEFPIRVQIINEDKIHTFTVWGFAYRGSKCYSCRNSLEDKNNLQREIVLGPEEERIVELPVHFDENIEDGEYNLKISVVKDHQKTSKDLTKKIQIKTSVTTQSTSSSVALNLAPSTSNTQSPLAKLSSEQLHQKDRSTGFVVYESNSQKAQNLIPLFLAASFGILCLALAWRK